MRLVPGDRSDAWRRADPAECPLGTLRDMTTVAAPSTIDLERYRGSMESSCGNRDKRTQPAPAVGSAWARACSTTPDTIYTQRALDRLKATGVEIADADIERLSPLGTDHINPHRPLTAAADARAAWMKRAVAPVSRSSHELSIAPNTRTRPAAPNATCSNVDAVLSRGGAAASRRGRTLEPARPAGV